MPSSIPQKTGYTFRGWRVRQAAVVTLSGVLSALNTSTNGTDFGYNNETQANYDMYALCLGQYGIQEGSPGTGCSMLQGSQSLEICEDLTGTVQGKWAVEFSYGIINGISECREQDDNGDNNYSDLYWSPIDGREAYCWCKITSYKPNNGNLQTDEDDSLSWVYQGEYEPCMTEPDYGYNTCKTICAFKCADAVKNNSSFRNSIFNAQ